MKHLTVLVGPPGSGKSTLSKAIKAKYINQDSQGKDHLRIFNESLLKGEDLVIDRMNFDKAQRARYIDPAKAAGYAVDIKVFVVPRKVCFDRAVARVGHETIKDAVSAKSAVNLFFQKYVQPTPDEGTVDFISYEAQDPYVESTKPRAIICDLDGTMCNIEHRLHYVKKGIEGQKPNWFAFFRGIPRDEVHEWCADIVRKFSTTHQIIYCSGRSEAEREMSEEWLKKNNLWFGHLFMRSAGDHRQDDIVKEIILDFDILTQFKPEFAIDDRQQVVDMWRKRGIVCLQCAKGDF
jgi:predicted kinase